MLLLGQHLVTIIVKCIVINTSTAHWSSISYIVTCDIDSQILAQGVRSKVSFVYMFTTTSLNMKGYIPVYVNSFMQAVLTSHSKSFQTVNNLFANI